MLEDLEINGTKKKGFGTIKYEVDDAEMLIQEYIPLS